MLPGGWQLVHYCLTLCMVCRFLVGACSLPCADQHTDDADDNYRSYPQGPPVQAPAYADSVGSSDRESLEEARQEYAEALDDARSSSASSDDRERLEEAREEYYSEEEEAYGSD